MKKYRLDVNQYPDVDAYKPRTDLIGHIYIEAIDEDSANEIGQMFATHFGDGNSSHIPSAPFICEYSAVEVE
ncbi:hypothetical protein MYOV065v1_p0019 [Vibrio phage PS15B.2]|nr:hypothetical protein MYOV065v1_p0019 [Vibrio phage PS15B.2]QZI90843.1 hypothetical protein MYOV066v1_p0065 [Vibrio phage PS15B.3]QZI90869.1 hypothetical protein MYOV064v1_p0019 [Vibrio phage PS15B.4]